MPSRESQLEPCAQCGKHSAIIDGVCGVCWQAEQRTEPELPPDCPRCSDNAHVVGEGRDWVCGWCHSEWSTEPKPPPRQGNPCCCDDGDGEKSADASQCMFDSTEKPVQQSSLSDYRCSTHGFRYDVTCAECASIYPELDIESPLPPSNTRQPFVIGSEVWPGAVKLMEECGELVQALGKLIAYPDGPHPDGGNTHDYFHDEAGDVSGALAFMIDNVEQVDGNRVHARAVAKLNRFQGWHDDQQ